VGFIHKNRMFEAAIWDVCVSNRVFYHVSNVSSKKFQITGCSGLIG
jgi:hypothetical protein